VKTVFCARCCRIRCGTGAETTPEGGSGGQKRRFCPFCGQFQGGKSPCRMTYDASKTTIGGGRGRGVLLKVRGGGVGTPSYSHAPCLKKIWKTSDLGKRYPLRRRGGEPTLDVAELPSRTDVHRPSGRVPRRSVFDGIVSESRGVKGVSSCRLHARHSFFPPHTSPWPLYRTLWRSTAIRFTVSLRLTGAS
jgi:hypothetical protein